MDMALEPEGARFFASAPVSEPAFSQGMGAGDSGWERVAGEASCGAGGGSAGAGLSSVRIRLSGELSWGLVPDTKSTVS